MAPNTQQTVTIASSLLREATYIELFSQRVSTTFCVAERLAAGQRSDSLPPFPELGNCTRVTTESESIPRCLAQADSLFTYWKKERSINQETCYPTKAISATEDFFFPQTQKMMAFWNGSQQNYPALSSISPLLFRGKLAFKGSREVIHPEITVFWHCCY